MVIWNPKFYKLFFLPCDVAIFHTFCDVAKNKLFFTPTPTHTHTQIEEMQTVIRNIIRRWRK